MARFHVNIDTYSADALAAHHSEGRQHDVVLAAQGRHGGLGESRVSELLGHVVEVDLDEISEDESLQLIKSRLQADSEPVIALTGVSPTHWRDDTIIHVVERLRDVDAPIVLAPPSDADLRKLAGVATVAMVYEPGKGTGGVATVGRRGIARRFTSEDALARLKSIGALVPRTMMAEPPVAPAAPSDTVAAPPPERFVNTVVAAPGTSEPVVADRPLALDAVYDVLVNVGQYVDESLLLPEEASWPEDLPGDIWLRAVLSIEGISHPIVEAFFLPAQGDSFSCDCTFGQQHGSDCTQRPWVRFTIHTPSQPTVLTAELVIYYEVAAVHAQRLTLPVSVGSRGPQATVLGRLSRSFNDLDKLSGRTASIVVSPSRVVVNGLPFADNPFAITAAAADTSALNVRQVLYDSHFKVGSNGEQSRYDQEYAKPLEEFERDLRYLAKEGAQLYARLFSPPGADNVVTFTMPELLREEASRRQRPPVLHVVDPAYDEHAMLWAAIYDLPVGGDPMRYELCPSIRDFGPGGTSSRSIPLLCPHEAKHTRRPNVLCPFGFWGLSCVIEQPPSVSRDLESVVAQSSAPVAVLLVAGSDLDPHLTNRHVEHLQRRLPGGSLVSAPVDTEASLAEALADQSMDVVYFYCHSGYDRASQAAAANRYLGLGPYNIEPINVSMWARTYWPDPHWPQRHPLVVLNGCHTTEATSGTVNSFVPAFAQWASSAGVLGTEVMMEQGLAGWVMEDILAAVAGGSSIGEAVRQTRWRLLARGNIMGLAYTPYCLANLALRSAAPA